MRKRIIFSMITLLVGVFIYYLYDTRIIINTNGITRFVRNFIPDFLWMFSFFIFSINFSKEITKRYLVLTVIYTITLGVIFELLQLTKYVKGTFDIFDVITYIISIAVACFAEIFFWRDENEKTKN